MLCRGVLVVAVTIFFQVLQLKTEQLAFIACTDAIFYLIKTFTPARERAGRIILSTYYSLLKYSNNGGKKSFHHWQNMYILLINQQTTKKLSCGLAAIYYPQVAKHCLWLTDW